MIWHSSFLDASFINIESEPLAPTQSSDALRASLQRVNDQLTIMRKTWEEEKKQLLGEKAILQDATKRLNLQVRNAEDELKRMFENEKVGARERADVQEASIQII